jgi:hypothetical protein
LTNNNLYSKYFNKAQNIYILMVISAMVSIVTIILSLTAGYLRSAIFIGVGSVIWSILFLVAAQKLSMYSRIRKSIHCIDKNIRDKQRLLIWDRIFGLLFIVGAAVGLSQIVMSDKPIFLFFESSWLLLIGLSHLFFNLLSKTFNKRTD